MPTDNGTTTLRLTADQAEYLRGLLQRHDRDVRATAANSKTEVRRNAARYEAMVLRPILDQLDPSAAVQTEIV